MFEICQAAEYGVRGIMFMTQMEEERPVLLKEIAQAEEISPTYLHKIFQKMVRSRILNSRRGVGYTLAKTPEKITLLDVIQAVEGPITIRPCIMDENYCKRSTKCNLTRVWTDLQGELVDKLSSISIRDLVTNE